MPVIAGRYEMLSQAGSGGMGSVFRARDLTTGSMVAVKVLKLDRLPDLARFEREATTLASVHHPNIVDYIAHGEDDGIHYLVQEWVDGITLGTHLSTVGSTIAEGVTIAAGVAHALDATHQRGVIHRDIKPSNIILAGGESDRVKLVDFGIARLANETNVLTRTGMLIGTPAYMSPEQARGFLQIAAPADVWALGCVLFEMLTGSTPFSGKTPAAIRTKVLLGDPPQLGELCPEAPIALCALLADMLEKDPLARPADGAAVVARLANLPAIPDGPRRRGGGRPRMTPQRPSNDAAPRAPASCFVMFDAASCRQAAGHDQRLARIGERHGMDVHVFDDGSAVFAARDHQGHDAAMEAVRAALELRGEVHDAAVSVFGHGSGDTLNETIDRGSVLLERATLVTMFGDVVDDDGPVIHLDATIAELIADEMNVVQTPEGPVLHAPGSG